MNDKGFSLIEVLIVMVIIGVLVILAIPSLRQAKMRANESWAMTYMRSWISAQELYKLKNNTYANSDELLIRDGFLNAPDPGGTDPRIAGYRFEIRGGRDVSGSEGANFWEGWADPVVPGATGDVHFYVNSRDMVIRYSPSSRASASSPVLNF